LVLAVKSLNFKSLLGFNVLIIIWVLHFFNLYFWSFLSRLNQYNQNPHLPALEKKLLKLATKCIQTAKKEAIKSQHWLKIIVAKREIKFNNFLLWCLKHDEHK
jgi:hypothetical protein